MTAYTAAREHAALRSRSERSVLVVTGADRLSWLQGLVTNDVGFGGPGAAYAAWLAPNGRMLTDLTVIETGEATWLDVPSLLAAPLTARLDSMIFAEDAKVADASGRLASIGLYGPEAVRVTRDVLGITVSPDERDARISGAGERAVIVSRVFDLGLPGVAVHGPAERLRALTEELLAVEVSLLEPDAASTLRVESGVPAFLVDMDDETIPFEANLDAALSHTKGCYVGQEIIVRIRDRAHGRVARKLVGLQFTGDHAPGVPQAVGSDGRRVGNVTSAVWSPTVGRPIALATVLRDFTEPGTPVVLEDGTAAIVAALPFVR